MHELAICQALIDEVMSIATDKGASTVSDIYVSVGPLSGVESQLLQNAFPIASAGTVAQHADLHLRAQPVTVSCASCGTETEVAANRLVCGNCADWRTHLVSGDELLLERVCLEKSNGDTARQEALADV
jgi:hydrogenase nickel incorporation protein HypA/HybF